jgi:hypothetical protein
MLGCLHSSIVCLNPYEIIRKYQCITCGEVMMCSCEKDFAERYLPHQISFATELNTQSFIPVTLGFQANICNVCRNLPETPYPMAEIYSRTSKIDRYYWREIAVETIKKFAHWAEERGFSNWVTAIAEHKKIFDTFEREARSQIRELHNISPKYNYLPEESHNDIISKYKVEVVNLDGIYVKREGERPLLLDNDKECSPEDFVKCYFQRQGYKVIFTESTPFHIIFSVFMWFVIQHPSDLNSRIVMFDRPDLQTVQKKIYTVLPIDFGRKIYGERRKDAINEHIDMLDNNKHNLLWFFDLWLYPSEDLRYYLWATEDETVRVAREIVSILPVDTILTILRYLIDDYWERYLGWPDLLVYNKSSFFFAEVKSSSDKLSHDQKTWVRDNTSNLHLPFKLIKIHKKRTITR